MKKKQKWELLKYAYDNYPKDSVARFKNVNQVDHVSNGKFTIHEDEQGFHVLGGDNGDCFYSLGEWATIVPEEKPSILTGKCAIQVNNEREFKLLMEHYEGKGWEEHIKYNHSSFGTTHHIVEYNDGYLRMDESNIAATIQYQIIPFADFAAEVGITVPVFVMQSEDGVPLYVGDKYSLAKNIRSTGNLWKICRENVNLGEMDFVITDAEHCKAFSTKEAAEKWCIEQNKPKSVEVKLFKGKIGHIQYDIISVYSDLHKMDFAPSDLEDLLRAYKTLTA